MEMLQIFIIATMCFVAHAQSTACMKDGNYIEKALACEDKLPKESCEALCPYASNAPKPSVGGHEERAKACWSKNSDGATLDNKVVKTAASLCPKTCALCCKSSKFDCQDGTAIDCAKAKKYCTNPLMKAELDLATNCPKTCGLCDEKNPECTDIAEGCDKALCFYPGFADVMKKQCKRTCGFCEDTDATTQRPATNTQKGLVSTSIPKATTATPCGADSRCAKWIENGFCGNPIYSFEMRKQYCGKTCGFC